MRTVLIPGLKRRGESSREIRVRTYTGKTMSDQ